MRRLTLAPRSPRRVGARRTARGADVQPVLYKTGKMGKLVRLDVDGAPYLVRAQLSKTLTDVEERAARSASTRVAAAGKEQARGVLGCKPFGACVGACAGVTWCSAVPCVLYDVVALLATFVLTSCLRRRARRAQLGDILVVDSRELMLLKAAKLVGAKTNTSSGVQARAFGAVLHHRRARGRRSQAPAPHTALECQLCC
jgi:hypothetical protein